MQLTVSEMQLITQAILLNQIVEGVNVVVGIDVIKRLGGGVTVNENIAEIGKRCATNVRAKNGNMTANICYGKEIYSWG